MTKDSTPSRCGFDVLLTQGWGKIAYNVVRSLGRARLRVIVGTDRLSGMAALSRYAAGHFRHPFVTLETGASSRACERLFAATRQRSIFRRVMIRSSRRGSSMNSRRREQSFPSLRIRTIRVLHKKNEVTALAASLGIPTPETLMPKDDAEVSAFFKEYGSDVVLKRISSSGARGVFYLKGDDEYQAWRRDANLASTSTAGWLLQRRVPGVGYGVSLLFNHGRLRAKFTHRRLREKTASGGIGAGPGRRSSMRHWRKLQLNGCSRR